MTTKWKTFWYLMLLNLLLPGLGSVPAVLYLGFVVFIEMMKGLGQTSGEASSAIAHVVKLRATRKDEERRAALHPPAKPKTKEERIAELHEDYQTEVRRIRTLQIPDEDKAELLEFRKNKLMDAIALLMG